MRRKSGGHPLRAPVQGRTFRGVMTSIDTLEIAKRLRQCRL
jgi:hypothetical protein